jgi:hypothetical protein
LKGRKLETKSAATAPATLGGSFSAEEDALLQDAVGENPNVSWPTFAGLMNRTAGSVKTRWYEHLCPMAVRRRKRSAPQTGPVLKRFCFNAENNDEPFNASKSKAAKVHHHPPPTTMAEPVQAVMPNRPYVSREFLHLAPEKLLLATCPPPPNSLFPEWSHEGSGYLGQRISRTVVNDAARVTSIVNGWVVGWLDASTSDFNSSCTKMPVPLWHVHYQDGELKGDSEDLEEDEIKEAINLHLDIVNLYNKEASFANNKEEGPQQVLKLIRSTRASCQLNPSSPPLST